MRRRTRAALVDRLRGFSTLVEVGVGRRTEVASALAAAGCAVRATDVADRTVPDGVAFHVDDVTDPDPSVFAGVEAVYALNLPPELHGPALDAAHEHGAVFAFTTLGGDAPAVPVRPETLPGETLYWAAATDGRGAGRHPEGA